MLRPGSIATLGEPLRATRRSGPSGARCAALACALLAASCGGGIVAGVFAGSQNRKSSPPAVQPAQITLLNPSVPLATPFPTELPPIVRVTVNNFALDQSRGDTPFVELRQGSTVHAQPEVLFARTQGRVTTFDSPLDTSRIFARYLTRPFEDVVVDFAVGVKRRFQDATGNWLTEIIARDVAPPAKLLLNRPPRVVTPTNDLPIEVSVDGTTRIRLVVDHLRASTVDDVNLEVFQRNLLVSDPRDPDWLRRIRFQGLTYRILEVRNGKFLGEISGVAPPSRFPGPEFLMVQDSQAGRAYHGDVDELALVPRVLYTPRLLRVTGGTAPITGGTQAGLEGSGLLPAKNDTGKLEYLFDAITRLAVIKENVALEVPREAIDRELSTEQRLAFRLPPPPDGLPGRAALELTLRLDRFTVTKTLPIDAPGGSVIRYATTTPVLGPFANVLPNQNIDFRPGWFFPTSRRGHDLAMLSTLGDFAQVALLRNVGAGVYQAAGAPISTRGSGNETARTPLGLVGGAIDGRGSEDVFALSGALPANAQALHGLLTSTESILSPFKLDGRRFEATSQVIDYSSSDFDGDGRLDVVTLSAPSDVNAVPELWRDVAGAAIWTPILPLKPTRGERVHAADLDGDGATDVAVVRAQAPFEVHVAWGDGRGGFLPAAHIVSYDTGLGKVQDGGLVDLVSYAAGGSGKHRHLLVVTGFEVASQSLPALVPLLCDPMARRFKADRDLVYVFPIPYPLSLAATMDIEGDAVEELILASVVTAGPALLPFALGEQRPAPLAALATDDALRNVLALAPGIVWDGGGDKVQGLLVLHSEPVDNQPTSVLSVLPRGKKGLVSRLPMLPLAAAPDVTTVGDLDGDGKGGDCAAQEGAGLRICRSQGPGLYDAAESSTLPVANLLPRSLATCSWSEKGDLLCWLETDGRLAVLFPNATTVVRSNDLRAYLPANLRAVPLGVESRLLPVDPDGDGLSDLCVLLRPTGPDAGVQCVLLFLDDKAVDRGELPFVLPELQVGGLLLSGDARDPQAGNLLSHLPTSDPGCELAIAFSDKLRFYELHQDQPPGRNLFEYDPGKVLDDLRIGAAPRSAMLDDLDGDGTDDLAFLVNADRRVQVFFNRITRTGGGYTGSLVSFTGASLIYPGDGIGLALDDFNGDGLADILVVGSVRRGSEDFPSLGLFRNKDRGTFDSYYPYPSFHTGSSRPRSFHTADLDGNGISDLILDARILIGR
jgi:hypothetical protein